MKLSHPLAARVGSLILFLSILSAGVPSRTALLAQRATPRTKPFLVGVVSGTDPDEPESNFDAVVLVENGKLKQPYLENNEASQKKFAELYFAPGKNYRLTFGGGEVGTAKVKSSDMGCNIIHAKANVEDQQKIPAHLSGLATDSLSLGKKPSLRRSPTDAERAAVMLMVQQIYRARGTSAALLTKLQTTNLTATDLNGDGAFELIGSFVIESKAIAARRGGKVATFPTGNARRDLLLMVEPVRDRQSGVVTSASTFKAALVSFQSYNMPPEGFDSAVDFVDQLDVDNDGIGEVFVRFHGYDSYGYSIYKKTTRGWREVYVTTGDAC